MALHHMPAFPCIDVHPMKSERHLQQSTRVYSAGPPLCLQSNLLRMLHVEADARNIPMCIARIAQRISFAKGPDTRMERMFLLAAIFTPMQPPLPSSRKQGWAFFLS